jgi:hypothetical protein
MRRWIWLFKKKDQLIESTGGAVSEYNKLRASVGMAPASDDDYCEAVAWVVVYDLFAPEVAEECKHLPAEKRGLFMTTYASYLSWLAMKGVESRFPSGSWSRIYSMLQREFAKQQWYQLEVMNRIFESMVKYPPSGQLKGRHFRAAANPWFGVVMAAKLAGFEMDFSTNARFIVYVVVTSRKILETIAKMAPKQHSILRQRSN